MLLCDLAELSLFCGQVRSQGATVSRVQGVVALGLGGGGIPTRQYLDCNGTNNAIENLQWSKDNGGSIATASRSNALRLDLTSADEQDEGIYTCRNSVTGDTVSINVTGGEERIQ